MSKRKYLYGIVIVFLFWEFMHLVYDSRLIPDPYHTILYLVNHIGVISINSLYSLYRIFFALLFVLVVGLPLGVLIGLSERADTFISPVLNVLYPVPKIAFLSIIMIIFGLGDFSKIFLIFFILIFQVILSIKDSVKNIDNRVFNSVYNLSLSKADMLRHIILPSIMPNLFTSLRIGIATGFSVLFLAENYATKFGIGYYIIDSWIMANYLRMFSGIAAIGFLGSFVFFILSIIERRVCKHKYL